MKCLCIAHLNGLISNSSVNKMLKQASSLAYKMCSHLQWNTVCYLKSSEVFEQPVTRNPPKAPILFCRRRSTWGGGGRTSPVFSPRCWWRSPTSGASASRVRRARVTPFCASIAQTSKNTRASVGGRGLTSCERQRFFPPIPSQPWSR